MSEEEQTRCAWVDPRTGLRCTRAEGHAGIHEVTADEEAPFARLPPGKKGVALGLRSDGVIELLFSEPLDRLDLDPEFALEFYKGFGAVLMRALGIDFARLREAVFAQADGEEGGEECSCERCRAGRDEPPARH